MADVKANKARIEQVAQMFAKGGEKFEKNLKIPMDKAKKLHEESNTPATEEIYNQCVEIFKSSKEVTEIMNQISKTLKLAVEDMVRIGILK